MQPPSGSNRKRVLLIGGIVGAVVVVAIVVAVAVGVAVGTKKEDLGPAPTGSLPTSVSLAPKLVDNVAGDPSKIPDQWLVAINTSSAQTIQSIQDDLNSVQMPWEIGDTQPTLGMFSMKCPEDVLGQAMAMKEMKTWARYVSPAFEVTVSQAGSWGLDRIDQRNLPLNGAYNAVPNGGAGVNVYVVDTGIRRTHTEFGGRAKVGFDAIKDGQNTNDCQGHGTHVAGTVGGTKYGVAKGVTLHAVRVLDCKGSGTNQQVVAGLNWVAANHKKPAVASMSLGGGKNTLTNQAVAKAVAAGVTVIVAAGNENQDACKVSPASAPQAITVGATERTDARASYSNFGKCTHIFAPGSGITSASIASNTATKILSGTSMATPHVSGVAALYLQQRPGATPAQVKAALLNGATPGKVTDPKGTPNRLLFTPVAAAAAQFEPETAIPRRPRQADDGIETGSLVGEGSSKFFPAGDFYKSTNAGLHSGTLSGPDDADFDLYLFKWSGSAWVEAAKSSGPTSDEIVDYEGKPGYYVWRVSSHSGGGDFSLTTKRP